MIAGFFVLVQIRVYSPIPGKKVRDSVSKLTDFYTHRTVHKFLIFNLFRN